MLSYDFEDSIGYWLASAHQAYMRAFAERLRPCGITFRQAQALGWLAAEGPLSQADLAARMLIEPPSLVGVLDRMESAGLIERQPCPDDRRKKLVHTLPAAEAMWGSIAECGRDLRSQATLGLSRSELADLQRVLKKVQQNVRMQEIASERS